MIEFLPSLVTVLRTGDAQRIGQKVSKMGTRTYLQGTLFPELQAKPFLRRQPGQSAQGHVDSPCHRPTRAGYLPIIWKFGYKPRRTLT